MVHYPYTYLEKAGWATRLCMVGTVPLSYSLRYSEGCAIVSDGHDWYKNKAHFLPRFAEFLAFLFGRHNPSHWHLYTGSRVRIGSGQYEHASSSLIRSDA